MESATVAGSKGKKWDKGKRNERMREGNFPERNSAESGASTGDKQKTTVTTSSRFLTPPDALPYVS